LLTHRQINKLWQKDYLLGGGNKFEFQSSNNIDYLQFVCKHGRGGKDSWCSRTCWL